MSVCAGTASVCAGTASVCAGLHLPRRALHPLLFLLEALIITVSGAFTAGPPAVTRKASVTNKKLRLGR